MKLVIVDDDHLVALSLKTILEVKKMEVLALGNSGEEAIRLYREHRPDVLLMDIRMDHMTGLEAAEHILKEEPDAKILFLTTFSDDEYIVRALKIGAKGYILKQDFDGIAPALLAVENGQTVFGNEIVNKITNIHVSEKPNISYEAFGVGRKEQEIIELVAKGLSNKEIASYLYLSEGTVRNYLSSILDKLNLRDRTQLAIFYYQHS